MAIENIVVVSGLVFAGGILTGTLVDGRRYGPLQHGENSRYEGILCNLKNIYWIHECMCIDNAVKIENVILFSTNIISSLIRFHTILKN